MKLLKNEEVFTVWLPDWSKHWHIKTRTTKAGMKCFHTMAEHVSGVKNYTWERAISYDDTKVLFAS